MSNRIQATFVSVWDNGIEIKSSAKFDPETGTLDEVQMAELPDGVVDSLEVLTGEYVRFGNLQYLCMTRRCPRFFSCFTHRTQGSKDTRWIRVPSSLKRLAWSGFLNRLASCYVPFLYHFGVEIYGYIMSCIL